MIYTSWLGHSSAGCVSIIAVHNAHWNRDPPRKLYASDRLTLGRILFETSLEPLSLLAQGTLLRERFDSSDPDQLGFGVPKHHKWCHTRVSVFRNSVSASFCLSFLPFLLQGSAFPPCLLPSFDKSGERVWLTPVYDYANHEHCPHLKLYRHRGCAREWE